MMTIITLEQAFNSNIEISIKFDKTSISMAEMGPTTRTYDQLEEMYDESLYIEYVTVALRGIPRLRPAVPGCPACSLDLP
jgi:hypothetical protein